MPQCLCVLYNQTRAIWNERWYSSEKTTYIRIFTGKIPNKNIHTQHTQKKWFVRLKAPYTRQEHEQNEHEHEHEHVKLPPLHSIASLGVLLPVTMAMAKSVSKSFSRFFF